MPALCRTGCGRRAVLKRPKTSDTLCKDCFYWAFETEIHHSITEGRLFKRGDSVAIAASGGKDSTVLAYILKVLNQRYDYGLKLMLLSIDEGITGYRDDSLQTVKQNQDDYEMPLKILSYKDLYGWTMDEIVAQIGRKNNCTFCGVFRRQALDRGATLLGVNCIATGHNADDIAETVLMNILRGDIARLNRCTAISTGSESSIQRVKPLKYSYEKEIVMYAHYKKLVYFSTECVFAPNAYRGHARALLKDMEKIRPSCIMDIIYSGETMAIKEEISLPVQRICTRCYFVSSQDVCKACVLLEGLNKGLPKLGIGKTSKSKRMLQDYNSKKIRDDQRTDFTTIKCYSETKVEFIPCKNIYNEGDGSSTTCTSNAKCGTGTCRDNEITVINDRTRIKDLINQCEIEESPTTDGNLKNNPDVFEEVLSNENDIFNEDITCAGTCGSMGSLQLRF